MNSNLELWLDHPITQLYRKLVKEHREAHINRILTLGTLTTDTLPELAQIKGQINALDLLLDIEQLRNFIEDDINHD